MATEKPWADVMPQEDVSSFRRGVRPEQRPMTAGVRPAVIVVDMTREFVQDDYPSGWGATGQPAAEANARLLELARELDVPVFFTKAFEDPEYEPKPGEFGRWKLNGPRPEPAPGTPPGDVIVDELAPLDSEIVIYKAGRPSGFAGTRLASLMIHAGCDTAIVTGMTTSGCVRATVLDAFMFNFDVVIPFECVADRSQLSHKVNLFDMHMKYADVVSLDETLDYMASLPLPARV